MQDPDKKTHSRRKFLSLSLLAGASLTAGKSAAQAEDETGEKVQLLTRDGKLVVVNKTIINTTSGKKPATKRDVIGWIHPTKD
jgi:hypothetical protein